MRHVRCGEGAAHCSVAGAHSAAGGGRPRHRASPRVDQGRAGQDRRLREPARPPLRGSPALGGSALPSPGIATGAAPPCAAACTDRVSWIGSSSPTSAVWDTCRTRRPRPRCVPDGLTPSADPRTTRASKSATRPSGGTSSAFWEPSTLAVDLEEHVLAAALDGGSRGAHLIKRGGEVLARGHRDPPRL